MNVGLQSALRTCHPCITRYTHLHLVSTCHVQGYSLHMHDNENQFFYLCTVLDLLASRSASATGDWIKKATFLDLQEPDLRLAMVKHKLLTVSGSHPMSNHIEDTTVRICSTHHTIVVGIAFTTECTLQIFYICSSSSSHLPLQLL